MKKNRTPVNVFQIEMPISKPETKVDNQDANMAQAILEKPKHVDVDEMKLEPSSVPTGVAANKYEAKPMDVDLDENLGSNTNPTKRCRNLRIRS